MRDYTRKAKIKDSNEWVIGYHVYVDYLDKHYILASEKIHDGFSGMLAMKQYEVDGNTICNPTGLTDKNGNKIWENDVLLQKTTEMHWCKWECMGVVKYGEHDWDASNYGYTSMGFYVEPVVKKGDINKIACGLNQVDINDEYYPIEVIGNIFDNADLLKGE